VELLVLFPESDRRFEWDDLIPCIKRDAEMRLFGASEETYAMYGIDQARGATVLVRPDGYVGMVCELEDNKEVVKFLDDCLVRVQDSTAI